MLPPAHFKGASGFGTAGLHGGLARALLARVRASGRYSERQVQEETAALPKTTAGTTDGVAGHDFLVFGNIFALDDAPGATCHNDGWTGSRHFRPTLDGGGTWSTEVAERDDASCSTHLLGTVIKLGGADDDADPDSRLLNRIHFFNNSIRTRSPLFRGSPAPPIASYNNAVQFIGCGRYGPVSCRQEAEPDPTCKGKDVWTADHAAPYAKCFALEDSNGRPVPHLMRFNAYSRARGLRSTRSIRIAPTEPCFGSTIGPSRRPT